MWKRYQSPSKTYLLLGLLLLSFTGMAQTNAVDFTRIRGLEDADVVVPKTILPLGEKTSLGIQAIIDYFKATGLATWTGMEAKGTLTTPGDEGEPSPATLTILNGEAFRLDVSAAEGKRSIRIMGATGQILESDGHLHKLPLATAKLGLIAFPGLMATSFPGAQTSIIDQGVVSVDSKQLQRVTVEEPVFASRAPSSGEVSTVDLYFDPTNHLLLKSVAPVQLEAKDLALYLQTITYGDYRRVHGMLLPFLYSQTLNGQRQWTLQLATVQLGTSADSTYFNF